MIAWGTYSPGSSSRECPHCDATILWQAHLIPDTHLQVDVSTQKPSFSLGIHFPLRGSILFELLIHVIMACISCSHFAAWNHPCLAWNGLNANLLFDHCLLWFGCVNISKIQVSRLCIFGLYKQIQSAPWLSILMVTSHFVRHYVMLCRADP